ncbi:50S ribosomal protein L18 [bacterium]|nr:50S ribosomal protein L18 [bacterium]MBR5946859.1 50S ribosomal protein L18 [bacterium]MBR6462333.1 50S ribosomal protein L18 [bacterium]
MKYTVKRKDLTPRKRRHRSMRQRVVGTVERPRLHVNCTLRYIYAQVIDDSEGKVLASATSAGKNYTAEGSRSNIAAAKEVGRMVAEAAKAKNITAVVFDRAGFKYHGKVKALADAAREAGLQF